MPSWTSVWSTSAMAGFKAKLVIFVMFCMIFSATASSHPFIYRQLILFPDRQLRSASNVVGVPKLTENRDNQRPEALPEPPSPHFFVILRPDYVFQRIASAIQAASSKE
uniref:Secreted protein n=1 Tax=Panagrellus redivivus TaxID=6233 RepID=A0A7E4V5J4_PANRE